MYSTGWSDLRSFLAAGGRKRRGPVFRGQDQKWKVPLDPRINHPELDNITTYLSIYQLWTVYQPLPSQTETGKWHHPTSLPVPWAISDPIRLLIRKADLRSALASLLAGCAKKTFLFQDPPDVTVIGRNAHQATNLFVCWHHGCLTTGLSKILETCNQHFPLDIKLL